MKRTFHRSVAVACLVVLFVSGMRAAPSTEDADIAVLRRTGKAFSRVAEKSMPAIVSIKIERIRRRSSSSLRSSFPRHEITA